MNHEFDVRFEKLLFGGSGLCRALIFEGYMAIFIGFGFLWKVIFGCCLNKC